MWPNRRVEFATSSRQLPTDLLAVLAMHIDFVASSQLLQTYLVERLKTEHVESVVLGGMYSPVGSRDPVSNSGANSTG